MAQLMKAVMKNEAKAGAVLAEVPVPDIKPHEVLVKVRSTSICGTDAHIYEWDGWAQSRIRPPLIMGHEFCGDIVKIGSAVRSLKAGDYISAETHITCGICQPCLTGNAHICDSTKILGVDTDGAFAEYVAIPESVAWKNDKSLPDTIAPVQEPFGNSVHATLSTPVAGKSVAIFGAGPTGLFATVIARACGAYPVIVSEINPYRMELAKKAGADIVLDGNSNVIEEIKKLTEGLGVDVSLIMSGAQIAFTQGLKTLKNGGRASFFGIPSKEVSINIAEDIIFKGIRIDGIVGRRMYDTWFTVASLLKRVNIENIITHTFRLEEFDKAFAIMLSGNSGKIVLRP